MPKTNDTGRNERALSLACGCGGTARVTTRSGFTAFDEAHRGCPAAAQPGTAGYGVSVDDVMDLPPHSWRAAG